MPYLGARSLRAVEFVAVYFALELLGVPGWVISRVVGVRLRMMDFSLVSLFGDVALVGHDEDVFARVGVDGLVEVILGGEVGVHLGVCCCGCRWCWDEGNGVCFLERGLDDRGTWNRVVIRVPGPEPRCSVL